MPIGISNINMQRTQPSFITASELADLIDAYFKELEGEYHLEEKELKGIATTQKVWHREPQPATFTGLALHLGFGSRQAMDRYKGRFNVLIKRARLRVEASYEKKLHGTSATAAMFALKCTGWNERAETPATKETAARSLKIKVIETGPPPVYSEKEVMI